VVSPALAPTAKGLTLLAGLSDGDYVSTSTRLPANAKIPDCRIVTFLLLFSVDEERAEKNGPGACGSRLSLATASARLFIEESDIAQDDNFEFDDPRRLDRRWARTTMII